MNHVESQMLEFIRRRIADGATSVPASEILAAVVPADHPEYRHRPAYKHGLERLRRRREIHVIKGYDGEWRYYLDDVHVPWRDAARDNPG